MKYAKPYNDYFADAGVKEYPVKTVKTQGAYDRDAIPLYIADCCIGAKFPVVDMETRSYISFEDYMALE